MISTDLTALLGINHPVVLAPMATVSGARLTRAVSEAGGFGILGGGYGDKGWLQTEIAKLDDVDGAFGIGFVTWSLAKDPELLEVALAADPRAIMLSFGDPAPFADASMTQALASSARFKVRRWLTGPSTPERMYSSRRAPRQAGTAPRVQRSTSCQRSSTWRPAGCPSSPPAVLPTDEALRRC